MIKLLMNFLWFVALIFLLGGGLYFSIKLKFPQLKFFSLFKGINKNNTDGITPLSSLSMSLAARIGVGSLSGIALAIYLGGPGTIFWIWLSCIITSINSYCETYLAVKYQEKNNNEYVGGPAYYISKGLNKKVLSKIYSVLIIITYIIGFISIQSNTIVKSVNRLYNINCVIVSLVLVILSALIILKGLNGIVNITNKLVPVMGIGYIIISIIVITSNLYKIPILLSSIFHSAFSFKSFGIGILSTFLIGIQRGTFCTESGLGTGSIAASCTAPKDKISYSLMQIIGIYFTVFVICTATALIILTSDFKDFALTNINGIELTQHAFNYHLGSMGPIVLLMLVISLAYSTIISGYYYGENNFLFLSKNKNNHIIILKLLTLLLIFIGGIANPKILWDIVDITVAILSIINMYVILKLRHIIIKDYKKL